MKKLPLFFLVFLIIMPFFNFQSVHANPGWLTGWSYRKSHVINNATGAGTNYQMRVKAHYGSGSSSGEDIYLNNHSRTDFGDVRFTDDDGTTLLDYWIESKVDSDYAIFWVEVTKDLSTVSATVYIYYGNSGVSTASDIKTTFLFGNDFEVGDLDALARSGSNPVFSPSGSGFDAIKVTDPCIIKEGSTYYMFYTAYPTTSESDLSIGQAHSSDMITWVRDGQALAKTGTGWEQASVAAPFCIKEGNTFYLFYQGYAAVSDDVSIGVATTTNIANYTSWVRQGQMLPQGGTGTWDEDWTYDPCVIKVGGTYYLFYCGYDADATLNKRQTGYATAASLLGTWTRYSGNPVLSYGTVFGCESVDVHLHPRVEGFYVLQVITDGTSGGASRYIDRYYKNGITGSGWVAYPDNHFISPQGTGWEQKYVIGGGIIWEDNNCKIMYAGWDTSNIIKIGYANISEERWNWNICQGSFTTWAITTEQAFRNSKSVKLDGATVNGWDRIRTILINVNWRAFRYAMRPTSTTYTGYFILASGTDQWLLATRFDSGGTISILCSAGWQTVQTYSINTWYDFEIFIDWTNNNFDLKIDGVTKATDKGFYTALTDIDRLEIADYSGYIFYADLILVRKFTDPEPSHGSWGSEETGGQEFSYSFMETATLFATLNEWQEQGYTLQQTIQASETLIQQQEHLYTFQQVVASSETMTYYQEQQYLYTESLQHSSTLNYQVESIAVPVNYALVLAAFAFVMAIVGIALVVSRRD